MKQKGFWIVTLRRSGDDEDSLYIVEANGSSQAMTRAEAEFRKDVGMPRRTEKQVEKEDKAGDGIYINYVVWCRGTRPEIFKDAMQ